MLFTCPKSKVANRMATGSARLQYAFSQGQSRLPLIKVSRCFMYRIQYANSVASQALMPQRCLMTVGSRPMVHERRADLDRQPIALAACSPVFQLGLGNLCRRFCHASNDLGMPPSPPRRFEVAFVLRSWRLAQTQDGTRLIRNICACRWKVPQNALGPGTDHRPSDGQVTERDPKSCKPGATHGRSLSSALESTLGGKEAVKPMA